MNFGYVTGLPHIGSIGVGETVVNTKPALVLSGHFHELTEPSIPQKQSISIRGAQRWILWDY